MSHKSQVDPGWRLIWTKRESFERLTHTPAQMVGKKREGELGIFKFSKCVLLKKHKENLSHKKL